MAKITIKNFFKCAITMISISTIPKFDWFHLILSILKTVIKHPNSIFIRESEEEQSHFLTDYLSHEVVVQYHGLKFLARPKYEDFARFLFSQFIAKWEPMLEIPVKKDNIVIDIGANVGFYTLKFSPMLGKNGKLISVEPDPKSFETLKRNCELNDFTNIELHNLAISEKKGTLKLFLSKKHSGKSSLYDSQNQNDFYEIPTISLDQLLNFRFSYIDFIKIDTEGAELSILKGAENTLKITKKILIELHEEILKNNNQSPFEIEKILRDNGFKIKTFSEYWDPNESSNKLFKSDYLLGEK